MDRFTKHNEDYGYYVDEGYVETETVKDNLDGYPIELGSGLSIDRLAAYEDTGLLPQEVECLTKEIDRLNQWVNDLQSGMYVNCVYCGHRYGPAKDTPVSMADVLKQHIEKCPKHPVSALKRENEELKAEIDRLEDDTCKKQMTIDLMTAELNTMTERAEKAEKRAEAAIELFKDKKMDKSAKERQTWALKEFNAMLRPYEEINKLYFEAIDAVEFRLKVAQKVDEWRGEGEARAAWNRRAKK